MVNRGQADINARLGMGEARRKARAWPGGGRGWWLVLPPPPPLGCRLHPSCPFPTPSSPPCLQELEFFQKSKDYTALKNARGGREGAARGGLPAGRHASSWPPRAR